MLVRRSGGLKASLASSLESAGGINSQTESEKSETSETTPIVPNSPNFVRPTVMRKCVLFVCLVGVLVIGSRLSESEYGHGSKSKKMARAIRKTARTASPGKLSKLVDNGRRQYPHEESGAAVAKTEAEAVEMYNAMETLQTQTINAIEDTKEEYQILHRRPESPFESLWPQHRLPDWARKKVNYEVPPDKMICFVHVGKAGGSSIGCNLGFSLHCEEGNDSATASATNTTNTDNTGGKSTQKVTQMPGHLPKLTTHIFHKNVYDCHDHSAYFLINIRNPLDRIRSAFYYDRSSMVENDDGFFIFHGGKYFLDCEFWTLEELAQNGLVDSTHSTNSTVYNYSTAGSTNADSLANKNVIDKASEGVDSTQNDDNAKKLRKLAKRREKCRLRASESLKGTLRFPDHFYYNYQYYYQSLPENATILAIRSEHLAEDWNGIKSFLGGDVKDVKGTGDGVTSTSSEESPTAVIEPTASIASSSNFSIMDDSMYSSMQLSQRTNVNAHSKRKKDMYLSEESRLRLCQELCNEIQIYKRILYGAVNLKEEEVRVSLRELSETCPREAAMAVRGVHGLDGSAEDERSTEMEGDGSCSEGLPDISKKLNNERGYFSEERYRELRAPK